MSLRLIKAVAAFENADELHLARLLLLLREADRRSGKTVEGITKLAKLDFLLRYPNCLERALVELDRDPAKANIQNHERTTIESKMVRFRYGPWDDRYRRWIGLLVARGLVTTYVKGRTVHVGLTEEGRSIADMIGETEAFHDLRRRSDEIYVAMGKFSATKLKNFIYEVFPEIIDLKWGQEIRL